MAKTTGLATYSDADMEIMLDSDRHGSLCTLPIPRL